MRRVKLGHHYYHIISLEDALSGRFRGKNVVVEGTITDKPVIEFLPMELPSYRATFCLGRLKVEFPGSPCLRMGERVKVYGRLLNGEIMAVAVETEYVTFMVED
ncbi:MAG: GTP-binding protein [Thermococci archaeon]|nr:GTP-binding protein [Thermococci archaeon]